MTDTAIFWRNWVFRTHHNECFSPHHSLRSLPTFCCGSKNRLPPKVPSCFENTVTVFPLNSICLPFVILFLNTRHCHLIPFRVEGGKGSHVASDGTLYSPDKTTPRLCMGSWTNCGWVKIFIAFFAFLHSPFLNIFFWCFPPFLDIFPCLLISTYLATSISYFLSRFFVSSAFCQKKIFKIPILLPYSPFFTKLNIKVLFLKEIFGLVKIKGRDYGTFFA